MTPAFRTFLAVVLGVVAVAAAEKASQYQTGAQWLFVVLLVVAFVVALCAAGGAVYGVARAAATEWWWRRRARGYTPPERPLWPTAHEPMDPFAVDASLHWNQVYGEWALESARRARHAADQQAPVRDGWTQPMPTVVDAQPSPWSPPMAQAGGGR